MPDLDFAKPVTLTFHDGSIYTLVRGTWCDINGIPCDKGTAEYMQNLLDFVEWESEEDSLMADASDFLDF